jgi:two-component system, NarL family, nitrate/nitrite response regulator NarL
MSNVIEILIVDDHPLFREGVVNSLQAIEDFMVVGESATGQEALALAMALMPDVVLLDVSMPGWNGIVTAEKIAMACPAATIIMLTASEDKDKLLAALRAGARGYVLKGVSAKELADVIRSAYAGEVYVSASIASEILVSLTKGKAPDPLQELTDREREILLLIGTGLTNRAIGEKITLSEKTIKHYVTNILHKLQVRNRVEAALYASKHGLTDLTKVE